MNFLFIYTEVYRYFSSVKAMPGDIVIYSPGNSLDTFFFSMMYLFNFLNTNRWSETFIFWKVNNIDIKTCIKCNLCLFPFIIIFIFILFAFFISEIWLYFLLLFAVHILTQSYSIEYPTSALILSYYFTIEIIIMLAQH